MRKRRRLEEQPYLSEEGELSGVYQAKYQWIKMPAGEGVLLTQYLIPGDPLPKLTVTQGKVVHSNLPPQLPVTPVTFEFAGAEVEGSYLELKMKPFNSILISHTGRISLEWIICSDCINRADYDSDAF